MEFALHIFLTCGIFSILAIGLNLINGVTGQLSLGHAGFWAVGAYGAGAFGVYAPLPLPDWANLLVACFIGGSVASILGLVVGIPCLRLRGDYLAMATLGFSEIIRIAIMNTDFLGGPRGLAGIPPWTNLFWVYLWLALAFGLSVNLLKGTHGRAMMAIREDELAAQSIGIPTPFYKTLAFVMGACLAGVAGALFACAEQFLHPGGFTFMHSVIILLMAILGGLGNLVGAIVGAFILTIVPEFLRFLGETISQWRMFIYALLLIFLMLARPQGILGKK